MIRDARRAETRPRSIPRESGDDPPSPGSGDDGCPCIPRESGDDPGSVYIEGPVMAYSPRERG